MPAALPHPTSPYKGEEKASGEDATPVREYSGLTQPGSVRTEEAQCFRAVSKCERGSP